MMPLRNDKITTTLLLLYLTLLLLFSITNGSSVDDAAADETTTTSSSSSTTTISTTDGIIDWVRTNGGYFNEKLQIRRMDPTNDASPFGVYTTQDMDIDERVMEIPQTCYIQIPKVDVKDMDLDTMELSLDAYRTNLCQLSKRLRTEIELGVEESKYGPYVAYLQDQPTGQLPATWSTEGKNLLRQLLTANSDGVDWIDKYYKQQTGCIDATDSVAEHMMALTLQRCYDVALIPLWDMVNHDNGRVNVYTNSLYDEGGIKVWTSQFVKAGDEIYATYDKCEDCFDIEYYWGTPEILKDFGFVERYPQRWVFTDREIWFEIWEIDNDDDGKTKLEVRWDDHDYPDGAEDAYGAPNTEGIEFLRKELERIESVDLGRDDEQESSCLASSVPEHEYDVIVQYKDAAATAMRLAIEAATTNNKAAVQ